MNNLLETFDSKKVIMKTYIERVNTIIANDTMRNVIRENGSQQEDGSIIYQVYEGEIGKQELILLSDNTIRVHSHNEQTIDRSIVVTDTLVDLSEDEPLGIVADGYLVHLPAAIESTDLLESAISEIDPTIQPRDEK